MASLPAATDDPGPRAPKTPGCLPFPVVGIGGSAGGLQALIGLFKELPAHPGMAFVVILHLSPHHESNAAQILQQASAMPVGQVVASVPIEIDHVYVIAPHSDLLMSGGHLRVAEKERTLGPAVAIDVFFRTLAQVHRDHAFAIVLSGTGSDGAVGIAQVKAHGGITMAQAPEEAEFDDMPRAAVATGLIDVVLPVAGMGRRLIELWRSARRIRLPAADAGPSGPPGETSGAPAASIDEDMALQEILSLLRIHTRHDFRHYKRGTVLRRIERRLQINELASLAEYRDFLRARPEEAVPLLQDMLISVTSFFRDAPAFEALAHDVLPGLLRNLGPGAQARLWVAGCATGEESYSLAMLMREVATRHDRPNDVQVFATDIDDRALGIARRGVYPAGIAADVSPERLQMFFEKQEDRYRVQTDLRERILFATHNLLRDPPFSRLDLICCRNLLIYLDAIGQTSVLEMFHYALKPGGYLFLGSSESTDVAGALFETIDKKHRIYRVLGRMPHHGQPLPPFVRRPRVETGHAAEPPKDAAAPPFKDGRESWRSPVAHRHLQALAAVSPASVLVDAHQQILHLSPTAGRYMQPVGGVPSNDLMNNIEPDLRLELRTALLRCEQSQAKASAQLRRPLQGGGSSVLRITVHPLPPEGTGAAPTLVVFEEIDDPEAAPGPAPGEGEGEAHERNAAHLLLGKAEHEIQQLKGTLQDTLERSARSTEELKAANEELQAINEELRSATEELETSKEELQSLNEELTTVNFELRMKVEERGQLNDDLQNFITSSEIATIFVDRLLRVKRFTPQARNLFNLIASDEGRPLLDITHRLDYGELEDDVQTVFRTLRTVERQLEADNGLHFLARLLPYRTVNDRIEGVVLTFIDITALRQAEEQVRISEERLRVAAATTRDFAIITTDAEGLVTAWNAGAERIFGYTEKEMLKRPLKVIFTLEDQAGGIPEQELATAREQGRAEDERWHKRKDGSIFYCSGVITPLTNGATDGFVKIARDMTGSKRQQLAQENLLLKAQQRSTQAKMANDTKDRFLAVMSHELKQPLNLIQVNAELLTRLPETRTIPSAMRIGTIIQRCVTTQSLLINDLLDLSRIRTGKLRLNLESTDLNDIVVALATATASDIENKRIALRVDSQAGVRCHCDHVRVEQIVWNLLNNAIKFTPEGGRITLALDRDETHARITVSDSGIGIAESALPHVFEIFTQLDAHSGRENNGLGIGLSLVQELVKAHGGEVDASSDGPGAGSTFRVRLPLAPDGATAAAPADVVTLSFRNRSILMVDDDQDSVSAFAALLRLEGARVDAVTSSTQALELATTHAYDLMISDLSMPEIDGCALVAEVRRRKPDGRLLAIAMSGYGRLVDVVRAKEAGFDVHVAKPSSIRQIKAALSRFLEEKDRAF